MKIKKTIQGSIPSNKVYNSYNDNKHNVYSTGYLNDKLVHVGMQSPDSQEEVWIQKGKNLFNIGDIALQWAIYGDNVGASAEFTNTSGYMPVKSQHKYTFSYEYSSLASEGARSYIFYNSNKEYLNTLTYDSSIKEISMTPTQDGYVRVSYDKNCYNIQFELGNKTTYEEYVGKKIFLKNDSGNYEEMINASEVNALIPRKIYPSFNWDYIYTTDLQYTCFKVGRMVFLNIHTMGFHVSPENGTTIISNLPPTANNAYIGFYLDGGLGDGAYSARCLITPGGTINIHWGSPTQIGDSANKQYRCFLMYETNE